MASTPPRANPSHVPRALSPAQRAVQITFVLKGHLKNIQLAYLRAAALLARMRDEKLYRALKHESLEDYADVRLGLQRAALYHRVERVVMDDVPWILQYYDTFDCLYQPYVRGIEVTLLGRRAIAMKDIWLDKSFPESSRALHSITSRKASLREDATGAISTRAFSSALEFSRHLVCEAGGTYEATHTSSA